MNNIQSAIIATENTLKERISYGDKPTTPQEWGIFAEYLVAVLHNGAVWDKLPIIERKKIHGAHCTNGYEPSQNDMGIDVVTVDPDNLYHLQQVKWYKDGASISKDAIANLRSIAYAYNETLIKSGYKRGINQIPKHSLVYRKGSKIPLSAPGLNTVNLIELSDEDLNINNIKWSKPMKDYNPYDEVQKEILEKIEKINQHTIKIRMAVGSGKSYIIASLIPKHIDGIIVVIAPRQEIVKELVDLFRERLDYNIIRVSNGIRWPEDLKAGDVIVATGQTFNHQDVSTNDEKPLKVSALFVDEAHHKEGHEKMKRMIKVTGTRYDLSACLEGSIDIELTHKEAVEKNLISDAEFVFSVYDTTPNFKDMISDLIAHPKHLSILACFQKCKSAIEFAKLCKEQNITAESFTSFDDETSVAEALNKFREGKIRILCVVGKVEMGVNIHRCDTILFAEPWDSTNRTLQLMGRGVRLHPTKSGFFTILTYVGPDDISERLQKYLNSIHDNTNFLDPKNQNELENMIEIRKGTPHCSENVSVKGNSKKDHSHIWREIYNSVGLKMKNSKHEILAKYKDAQNIIFSADPPVLDYEQYQEWRLTLSEKEMERIPQDPAEEFNNIPGGFTWKKFLDRPSELDNNNIYKELKEAYYKAIEEGIIMGNEEYDNYLYKLIRQKINTNLTKSPLDIKPNMSWDELFKNSLEKN